jgi:hypothetical protein
LKSQSGIHPNPQTGFYNAAGFQEPLESSGMRDGIPSFTGNTRRQEVHSKSSPFDRMAEPQDGQTKTAKSSGETDEV